MLTYNKKNSPPKRYFCIAGESTLVDGVITENDAVCDIFVAVNVYEEIRIIQKLWKVLSLFSEFRIWVN